MLNLYGKMIVYPRVKKKIGNRNERMRLFLRTLGHPVPCVHMESSCCPPIRVLLA